MTEAARDQSWEATELVGRGQSGDRVRRGRKQHSVAVPGAVSATRSRDGFSGAGRTEQDDVACLGEESAVGKSGDLVVADPGLVSEVQFVERLRSQKARDADSQPGSGGVAGGDFPLEDVLIPRFASVIVVLITGTPGTAAAAEPGRGKAGLTGHLESYVDPTTIFTISKTQLHRRRGRRSPDELATVEQGLVTVIGLDLADPD